MISRWESTAQAVLRWLDDTEEKASRRDDINRLRWLHAHLDGVMLSEVDRYKLDAVIAAKKGEGASNATINWPLSIVRSILRKTVREWGWLDSMPKVRMLSEPEQRIRFLTKDEAERLLAELPAHLADMVRFSLETGLRQANVTGLLWNQLDLVRKVAWIHPDQAKARKAIAVPLSDVAVEIIRRQLGKHHTHVFSYRGQSVSRVNNHAWTKALARAGIENFRWHDLRHTWASWHVQGGTPLHVLQELGGWKSVEMVRRYAHLSPQHWRNGPGTSNCRRQSGWRRPSSGQGLCHFYYNRQNKAPKNGAKILKILVVYFGPRFKPALMANEER